MKETNWYVVRKGRKMGPMSRSQLDQLYNSDNLQPKTICGLLM
jgi:hypothetical protein